MLVNVFSIKPISLKAVTFYNYIMKKTTIVIVILSFAFFLPTIFAYEDNLSIDILTLQDYQDNAFFISNNYTKEIDLKIAFSSESQRQATSKISFEIYPDASGLEVKTSSDSFSFYNSFETTEKLYVTTKILAEQKTIILRVDIFDCYNNHIKTATKHIKIIPNNSNEYFQYTKTHSSPRLFGYSISRAIAVLNSLNDHDIISVFVSQEAGGLYSIFCSSDNPALQIDYDYLSKTQTDLNISIDKGIQLEPGEYTISCKLQDGYETMQIRDIKVRYEPKEKIVAQVTSANTKDQNVSSKPQTSTGLLQLSSAKHSEGSFTYILLAVFILMLFILFFHRT